MSDKPSQDNHTERRRDPRVHPAVDVLDYQGSDGVTHQALTDISKGGLRLVTTGPEQPGARVTLRLGLGTNEPVDVGGQVVWARQAEPFQTGIRFIGLSNAARSALSQLVGLNRT